MELIITTSYFFLLLFPLAHSSCHVHLSVLASAFVSVANFQSPACSNGDTRPLQELILPSRNLTGTVSWKLLSTIPSLRVVDLSDNSLLGSVPSGFWSSPSLLDVNLANNRLGGSLRFDPAGNLQKLNLSGNRFTNAAAVSALSGLRSLDLSRNKLGSVPVGLDGLRELSYLDVSCNSMEGDFAREFDRLLPRLSFLNVSYNNFSGKVDSEKTERFGRSAFVKAGSLTFTSAADTSSSNGNGTITTHEKNKHEHISGRRGRRRRRVNRVLVVIVAASLVVGLMAIVGLLLCVVKMRRRRRRERGWKEEERGVRAAEEVPAWVAEAKWTAPVVVFEKPLMELRFSDLAAATSGFGRESQLAEAGGRSGAAYRAVLPGDMNVVIRVAEGAREADEYEAAAGFREMAKLRHPNLLPLLGYCISGKEKLLLYEYMERGDLHRWLHELPTGHPDVEDWSADAWEPQHGVDKRTIPSSTTTSTMSEDWPTRHRVALGVARGLAFLHQGWAGSPSRPVVHGHLVPSNVLLGDDLEPRIADFFAYGDFRGGGAGGTPEGDVYAYGVLVMELVSGRGRWSAEEAEKVRKLVREGKGAEVVDPRIRLEVEGSGGKWEREMVECLQVGYLCTAHSPEKRPTMQQVVGLLKDIRATPASTTTATTSSTSSCN